MISRRRMLHGLGLAFAGLPAACGPAKEPQQRRGAYAGVDYVELFANDADETAPLVIAMHGRGDSPEAWAETWRDFPGRAWIALPRAFTRYDQGYSWFDLPASIGDDESAPVVSDAETKLWRSIAELFRGKKKTVLVAGFSQGAVLACAMAVRHPGEVGYAFSAAGALPPALLPKNKARAAPVVAFHGTADDVLDIKLARATIAALRDQGSEASLKEYPGAGHGLSGPMRGDLFSEIQKQLGRSS